MNLGPCAGNLPRPGAIQVLCRSLLAERPHPSLELDMSPRLNAIGLLLLLAAGTDPLAAQGGRKRKAPDAPSEAEPPAKRRKTRRGYEPKATGREGQEPSSTEPEADPEAQATLESCAGLVNREEAAPRLKAGALRLLAQLIKNGDLPGDLTIPYRDQRTLGAKDLLAEADRLDRPVRIDDHLYVTRSGPVWLCMQRIDAGAGQAEAARAWVDFVKKEHDELEEYYERMEAKDFPKDRRLPTFGGENDAEVGVALYSFEASLQDFLQTSEVWVAFISTAPVTRATDVDFGKVEMFTAILTDPDAPMYDLMGISRSFSYLNQVAEEGSKLEVHRHLSMRLHGYAAAVMRARDPNKLYQIISPVPKMEEIMRTALHGQFYDGTTQDLALEAWRKAHPETKELPSASELNQIESTIRLGQDMTPIRRAASSKAMIALLDKSRTKAIYAIDLENQLAFCNNKAFTGDEVMRFGWMHTVELDSPMVVDLDVLEALWY